MPALFETLTDQNPWWTGREFETGKPRPAYLSNVQRYIGTGEIVVLGGVRRSGKTTLLFQAIRSLIDDSHVPPGNILFVNCDEPAITSLEQPLAEVLDTYRKEVSAKGEIYLFFDEIQGIPGWERMIKALYDRKQYRIIISGSSSYLLDSQLSTLLSGRYLAISVFPLDFSEYLTFHGVKVPIDAVSFAAGKYEIMNHLKRYLREGGFPIVVLQDDERTKTDYLLAYYDSIVYRDIVRVNDIRNQQALAVLLHYLITNITSPFSYRRLKHMLGIDIDTIRNYIHFAGNARILFEVSHFAYSLPAQHIPNRKVYCIDNGLRNAVSFRFSEDEGKLAENLVFVELLRSRATPFYWKKGKEVDFVIKGPDSLLTAINVSYTDDIADREREGLQEFAGEFGDRVGEMIILTKDTDKVTGGIKCIPLWKWLLRER